MRGLAVKISSVDKGSLCDKKKIAAGDCVITVNGNPVKDVLDYRFYLNDTKITLEIRKENGKIKKYRFRKSESEDIGLNFETYLMDKQHACKNKCIFCFIDQLPKGLRDSLYFKDDDDRLSFLFGNYVTLTNLDDEEVERLIKMRISPINISVHTMNPQLRVEMMKNSRSGECLAYIKKFADAGIDINAQLVLCPGINDGKELEFSLKSLFEYYPAMKSIACVPVGITAHRQNLPHLESYNRESARRVIETVDRFNREFEKIHGEKIAYASDEFYLIAEEEMPGEDYYDDYPQLENGVGMWTLMKEEFSHALENCEITELSRKVTLVTGTAAFPLIEELAGKAMEKITGLDIQVVPVINHLFGETVTVSGLITGGDIITAVEGKELGEELVIPPNCLRKEGDMFLDNMTVDELSEKLGVKVRTNANGGDGLLRAMTGGE